MTGGDDNAEAAEKQAAVARVLAEVSEILPKKSEVTTGVIRGGPSILVKHPGEGHQAGKNVVDVFIGKSYADAAEKAIAHYMKGKTNGMNRRQRRAAAAEARRMKRSS